MTGRSLTTFGGTPWLSTLVVLLALGGLLLAPQAAAQEPLAVQIAPKTSLVIGAVSGHLGRYLAACAE
jgi:hypothetical protein